jgi:hypothetical protein
MAAPQDPLRELTELLDNEDERRNSWAPHRDALRAQGSATASVLNELVHTTTKPERQGVEVLLTGPGKEWVDAVERMLLAALPDASINRNVATGSPQDLAPDYIARDSIALPDLAHASAVQKVKGALASMTHLKVDYSEPIDLIVVTPKPAR